MTNFRTAAATLVASAALVGAVGAPAYAAPPVVHQDGAQLAKTKKVWHRDYFYNYFYEYPQCVTRGEGAIGNGNHDQLIRQAVAYRCVKHRKQTKYSMDILFVVGGGGGGGSWSAPVNTMAPMMKAA